MYRRETEESINELNDIDVKTAKIVCPAQLKSRISKLRIRVSKREIQVPVNYQVLDAKEIYDRRKRLAALRSSVNEKVNRVNVKKKLKTAKTIDPEKLLNQYYEPMKAGEFVDSGALIKEDGSMIKPKDESGFDTHYDVARELNPKLGIKFLYDKPKDSVLMKGIQSIEDEDIHNFLKATKTIRLQSTDTNPAVHIATRLSMPQIKTLKDLETDKGEVQFGVGDEYDDSEFGSGVRNLLRIHAKIFGFKQAQEDDVDTNVNMTYKKSKPHKTYKELFPDERGVKTGAQEHPSITKFKQHKITPDLEEGFGFDPRHNDFVTPETARQRYGKPGVSLHFIATTDNPGPVENIAKALDNIGPQHFIGGWKSSTGFKTDASFILNTNDTNEVITNLRKYNQEASYSLDPEGNPFFVKNPDFIKKPRSKKDLVLIHEGKEYATLGDAMSGWLDKDEVRPQTIYLENRGQTKIANITTEANFPHKVTMPDVIKPGEKKAMLISIDAKEILKVPDKSLDITLKYEEFLKEFGETNG